MMERWVAVSIAVIASAAASGGVAIAVSYRLWGADTAALQSEREVDRIAMAEMGQRLAKVDKDNTDTLTVFKAAINLLPKQGSKEWWCMYLVSSTGSAPTDGICYPNRKMCDDTRIAALDRGERSAPCIKQGSAVCVGLSRSRGQAREDKCWATSKGCIDDVAWIEKNGGTVIETCRRE